MDSKVLDVSQVDNGEVKLAAGPYTRSFVLIGRKVKMRIPDRGSRRVPEPYRSAMFRDARAILKGKITAQSDCGW